MTKYFTWLLKEPKFIFITSLTIEKSVLILKNNIGKQSFFGFPYGDNEIVGKVDGNSFLIHKKNYGKKINPIFSGNIISSNGKTIIKGCFVPNSNVLCAAIFCIAFIVTSFISIIYSFLVLIRGEAYGLHLFVGSIFLLAIIVFLASKAKYVLKSDELYFIDFFKKVLKADILEWNRQEKELAEKIQQIEHLKKRNTISAKKKRLQKSNIFSKSVHCPTCGKYRDNIQLGKYKCSNCGQKFEIHYYGIRLMRK